MLLVSSLHPCCFWLVGCSHLHFPAVTPILFSCYEETAECGSCVTSLEIYLWKSLYVYAFAILKHKEALENTSGVFIHWVNYLLKPSFNLLHTLTDWVYKKVTGTIDAETEHWLFCNYWGIIYHSFFWWIHLWYTSFIVMCIILYAPINVVYNFTASLSCLSFKVPTSLCMESPTVRLI